MKVFSSLGEINRKGGLSLYRDELDAFLNQNTGHRIVATFEVLSGSPSERRKKYYFGVCVPRFRDGLLSTGVVMSLKDTEEYMRSLCPFLKKETVNYETGEYSETVKTISEIGECEMTAYLDFIKQFAAEWFAIYIEDPRDI